MIASSDCFAAGALVTIHTNEVDNVYFLAGVFLVIFVIATGVAVAASISKGLKKLDSWFANEPPASPSEDREKQ
jgi:hypothetical protein